MNETTTLLVLAAFDVVIFIFGIYMVIAALKMKNTKEPGKIVLTEEEVQRCQDKTALANYLYKKEAVMGCVFILCGTVRLLDKFVLKIGGMLDIAMGVLLIVAAFWFLKNLQTARAKFL